MVLSPLRGVTEAWAGVRGETSPLQNIIELTLLRYRSFQGNLHHPEKSLLPVFGRSNFMGYQAVGDGKQGKSLAAVFCGQGVEFGTFHFHGDTAEFGPELPFIGILGVKHIRRDYRANRRFKTHGAGSIVGAFKKVKRSGRGIVPAAETDIVDPGVRTRGHGDYQVPELYVPPDRTRSPDTESPFYAVILKQLVDIDRD
jgi:hypothetical protein